MKPTLILSIFLITLFSISCNSDKSSNVKYKKYISQDNAYEVDIPEHYDLQRYLLSNMLFVKEPSVFLAISELENGESLQNYSKKLLNDDGFNYTLKEKTDTTCYYSVSKKNSILSSDAFFMSKKIDNHEYVIYLFSTSYSEKTIRGIIRHIHASLVAH